MSRTCHVILPHTDEIYSYEDVRKLYLERLAFAWMEDSTMEVTRVNVERKIDSFVEGDLDHAAETLSELWEIASKDGDVKPATSDPVAPVSYS